MITSFNDYPDYFYSSFFIRLFAFLVDLIIVGSIQRILLFSVEPSLLKVGLSLGIYLLYFILTTKLNKGQTLGKTIFGIKVISLGEEKLTWRTVIVREGFGRYILKVLPVFYGLSIFTRYKQHLVDQLTDTSVVTVNYLKLLESTTYEPPEPPAPTDSDESLEAPETTEPIKQMEPTKSTEPNEPIDRPSERLIADNDNETKQV